MRVPAFAADVFAPGHRRKLWWGLWSGYGVAAAFLALAALGVTLGVVPFRWAYVALVGLKVATNSASWWALKRDRFVFETSSLNLVADVLAMTGAIYWTGGVLSPLLPIYAIEITVIALLTNLAVTVRAAGLVLVVYGAMVVATALGEIERLPPPVALAGGVTPGYLVAHAAFTVFVLAAPTYFASRILVELRAKQRALERTNEALMEAGRNKSQFMANVTHELRTPIHGICGLTDLVETGIYGPVTEEQRDAQRSIKQSALSLLRMIDDLLELARADAGRLEPTVGPVDPREVVQASVDAVRWMRGTKDVELRVEIDDELPTVESDARYLKQIVLNLVTNAVKFTSEGGHVTVRARGEPGALVLEVEDDGPGIAEAERESIFDPFHQVDGSPEREYGGVGLGLALVARLADALGARVEVDSELGHGATFRVRLAAPR